MRLLASGAMPLRLLHTADWHLGHTLHGLERTREHRAFLDWLLGVLEAEEVDALLVAGDVFDATNPPAAAVALWYQFLAEAWRRLPALQILVIGGNHDSAARLDAPHPLLDALGRLRVVGGLPRKEGAPDYDALAVPIHDRAGAVAAVAAAIPFLRPSDLALVAPATESDGGLAGARAIHVGALEAARRRAGGEVPLIAVGHLHLAGGQVSDLSERKVLAGHLHALPSDLFPDDVAYVALGHLHLAQRVGGREHVRYAGSPIPLSFAERSYPHQVMLVDLAQGAPAALRPLAVPRVQELRRVPDDGPRPLADVLAVLSQLPRADALPEEDWPWLEVQVELPAPEPALRSMLEGAVSGKAARLVRIAPPRLTGTGASLADAAPRRSLGELTPDDVFRLRWSRDHEGAPPPELVAAFHEVLDALSREEAAA
jgi:exonuclease SbcD